MKKILLFLLANFFLLYIIVLIINGNNMYDKVMADNVNDEYIYVKLKNLNLNQYQDIESMISKYNIKYYYIDLSGNNFFRDTYTIKTNVDSIKINNEIYDLSSFCLVSGVSDNSECQKTKRISKDNYVIERVKGELNNGFYIFFDGNLTTFGKELSLVNSDTVSSSNFKIYIKLLSLFIILFINTLFNYIYLFRKILKNKIKRNMILLSGYSVEDIVYNDTLKFGKVIFSFTLIYSLVISLLSILIGMKLNIFIILILIYIFYDICLIVSNSILIYVTTGKDISSIIKYKIDYEKVGKIINFIKILVVIVISILLIISLNLFIISYSNYNQMSSALNIRDNFGKFQGTNSGNDTDEYFHSQQYHDNESKASKEILNNIDFFYSQVAIYSADDNDFYNADVPVINTEHEYLNYNNVTNVENKIINEGELNSDTCYYLVPEKYTKYEPYGECKKEEIINLENGQELPSYDYLADEYGMVKDPIIIMYPEQYLVDNGNATYDNIYYPLDNESNMKNFYYVKQVLEKYGIYDNVSKFFSLNEILKYEFLGVVTILKVLALLIVTFFILLYFVLKFSIDIYFEENILSISLYSLEGYSKLKIYNKFFVKLLKQGLFEIVAIELLCLIFGLNIIISIIVIFFDFLFIIVSIFRSLNKIEQGKLYNLLKGREL